MYASDGPYFDRARAPGDHGVRAPSSTLEDVGRAARSAAPWPARVEPRDYVDTAAALDRYTTWSRSSGFARRLGSGPDRPGFRPTRRNELGPLGATGVFASFGLGPDGIGRTGVARFASWPPYLSFTRIATSAIDGLLKSSRPLDRSTQDTS